MNCYTRNKRQPFKSFICQRRGLIHIRGIIWHEDITAPSNYDSQKSSHLSSVNLKKHNSVEPLVQAKLSTIRFVISQEIQNENISLTASLKIL